MKHQELTQLIEKYLEGTCTPEEIQLVHEWYDAFPDLEMPPELLNQGSRQRLQQKMLNRVRFNITAQPRERPHINWSRTLTYTGIAAAVCIIALLLFWQEPDLGPQPKTVKFLRVENSSRSLQKKTLPDGSDIWLHPGSTIEYPIVFAGSQRRVTMRGEAFFLVTPNKEKPFVIHSGSMETRVWGTSFRVRDYPGIQPEVYVATGRVSVKLSTDRDGGLMLAPNEKAELETRSGKMAKKLRHDPDPGMKMWGKASISFTDRPLAEVARKLNRQFSSNIVIPDKAVAAYLLTADFNDQNLADILDMLRKSLNIDYTISGSQIQLIKN